MSEYSVEYSGPGVVTIILGCNFHIAPSVYLIQTGVFIWLLGQDSNLRSPPYEGGEIATTLPSFAFI